MPDCDREALIGAGHVGSTVADALMLRALWRFAVLAAVCIVAAACVPEHGPEKDTISDAQQVQRGEAVARGRDYAEKTCAACHAIAAGQTPSPDPKAPTFESVANTPGMTITALNAWLHTSHRTMPNLIIDPDRIEDLSAYISTLKKRDQRG